MSLQVGSKTNIEHSQLKSSNALPIQSQKGKGYSEISILSPKSQNEGSKTGTSCLDVLKRIASAIWYCISFQWLCGKSKKNETEETTSSSAVSSEKNSASSATPKSDTKKKAQASPERASKTAQETFVNPWEQEQKRVDAFLSSFLAKVTYPLSSAEQQEFTTFMESIKVNGTEAKGIRAKAANKLADEMFKRAELSFSTALKEFKNLEPLITKQNVQLIPNKTFLDDSVVHMLRTVAFCCSFTDNWEKLLITQEDVIRHSALKMMKEAYGQFEATVVKKGSNDSKWIWCLENTSLAYTRELLNQRIETMQFFCSGFHRTPVVWTSPRNIIKISPHMPPQDKSFTYGWNNFDHFEYLPYWFTDRIPACLKDFPYVACGALRVQ